MGSTIMSHQMTMGWCENLDDRNSFVTSPVPIVELMSSNSSKSFTVTVVTRFVVTTAYCNGAVVS